MHSPKVTLLSTCIAFVAAFAPAEELHFPKPYSFGYAIKDKHGEQHRHEIGDGLHTVKGSYGFKDERGIDRQVNYVADKGGFRAEVKTNEPGTAPLNPSTVKMESSAHPFFGISKPTSAVAESGKEGLGSASGFGYHGILKLDAVERAKAGMGFDVGLAKENKLEKKDFKVGLMKEGLDFGAGFSREQLAKEMLAFSPIFAEESLAKATETAKGLGLGLDNLFNKGFALVPLEAAAKEATLETEGLTLKKSLETEELAKLGHMYSALLANKNLAFRMKQAEIQKALELEKFPEAYALAPKFSKATFPFAAGPLRYAMLMPKGFAYGGPIKGGFVRGYNARFF